jgi:peptidoglycan/xylan/chitin deacetylase (PgdA/CDA1 family)
MRRVFWELLRWAGVLWAWRFYHRHRIPILMMHGVMDTEQATAWVPLRPQLSRRALDHTLSVLARYYRFVSLDEAVAMLAGRIPVQPNSLVLTFDDGYRNNLTHALPILRCYHAPATVFVATGHINQQKPFWFDRLDYILQRATVDGRRVQIGQTTVVLRAQDRDALQASYRQLRNAAKDIDRPDHEMLQELEDLAAILEQESGHRLQDIFADDDWSGVLTWQDMQTATGRDVLFGSHTVDHVRIAMEDDEFVRRQLGQSKQAIEEHLGKPCQYFCYPNGSVSPRAAELVAACGYTAAVTTEEGSNGVGDNLMTLRRFDLPLAPSPGEILAQVSGLSSALSRFMSRCATFCRIGHRSRAVDRNLATSVPQRSAP